MEDALLKGLAFFVFTAVFLLIYGVVQFMANTFSTEEEN